jgi:conjugal transfer pilus assembly protein TraW
MKRAVWFAFSFFLVAEAKDLGTFGECFEIAETDLLEEIQMRLQQLEKTGELKAAKERIQRMVRNMILHPRTISGLGHTEKTREFKYDTSITISRDLRDYRGRVFAKKGERFNPLEKIRLSKPLLFIDGDDEAHIKWAIAKIKDHAFEGHNHAKVILVNGAPLELQKRLQREIFFDQNGTIIHQLGIKQVPAIVFQKADEKLLTIIEETPAISAQETRGARCQE